MLNRWLHRKRQLPVVTDSKELEAVLRKVFADRNFDYVFKTISLWEYLAQHGKITPAQSRAKIQPPQQPSTPPPSTDQ